MVHAPRPLALLAGMIAAASTLLAQAPYIPPSDPQVQQKLAQWQDLKFGLLMHWGPYSQWGVVESWSICPEDEPWCQRDTVHGRTYNEYLRNYEALQTTFNPLRFDPAKWARAAKDAGMKYVVFTTKHHDGFCMFDTKLTDYRITSPNCPFHTDPRANVAKQVFDSFRHEGLWAGAYFSKPDWHSPYYWWPYFPPKDRNVNYHPAKYPGRWQRFKDFTYGQIEELMTGYGPLDILWLDGGQVRPANTVDPTVDWQRAIPVVQDIDMPRIAAMARQRQPGILVVDRTVGGKYENYVTPEGHVPDHDLGVPWETCMPMGTSWSWVPNERYKSTDEIIRTLVNVVTRGGSLLLNVGPRPDGQLDSTAYTRLAEVGQWLRANGEAVYGSRALAVDSISAGVFGATIGKDGSTYLFCEPGQQVAWLWGGEAAPKAVTLANGRRLRVIMREGILHIAAPADGNGKGMCVIKLGPN